MQLYMYVSQSVSSVVPSRPTLSSTGNLVLLQVQRGPSVDQHDPFVINVILRDQSGPSMDQSGPS